MTDGTVTLYARAVMAHIDAQRALRDGDHHEARAAYRDRTEALEAIVETTGEVRSAVFSRIALLARDAVTAGAI